MTIMGIYPDGHMVRSTPGGLDLWGSGPLGVRISGGPDPWGSGWGSRLDPLFDTPKSGVLGVPSRNPALKTYGCGIG